MKLEEEIITQTTHEKTAPKGAKGSRGLGGFSSPMKEAWYCSTISKRNAEAFILVVLFLYNHPKQAELTEHVQKG